jgi:ubiquinone/menaquinone biosynthesis C-methylase UbiE
LGLSPSCVRRRSISTACTARCARPARARACASSRCSPRPTSRCRTSPKILRQSQPRISRHLKLLAEAGLVDRFREGSWAFYRLGERGGVADIAQTLVGRLDPNDAVVMRDRGRLAAVRAARAAAAQTYFSQHAAEWDRIRRLHVATRQSRARSRPALADRPIRSLLDLGTGTGRMLELFGPHIERGLGIDMSLDMLSLARARLERAGLKHCSVRQGDIYELPVPKDSFDVVLIHQVLHFLDDGGRAIAEAARTLRPQGPAARSSTSRRTIWNSCARSTRICASASRPKA